MISYKTQLSSDKWKKKKQKILKRDKYSCRGCGSNDYLHVHHTYYIHGLMAWQVPNEFLVTLCANCHKFEHSNNDLKSFILSRKSEEFKKVAEKYSGLKNQTKKKVEKKISLAQKVQLQKHKVAKSLKQSVSLNNKKTLNLHKLSSNG